MSPGDVLRIEECPRCLPTDHPAPELLRAHASGARRRSFIVQYRRKDGINGVWVICSPCDYVFEDAFFDVGFHLLAEGYPIDPGQMLDGSAQIVVHMKRDAVASPLVHSESWAARPTRRLFSRRR